MEPLLNPLSPNRATLRVQRRFAASRERVFRAWTERDALQHWFKPGDVDVAVIHLDVRVGGRFEFESTAGDGTRVTVTGEYIEVIFPSKLIFTWDSNAIGDNGTLVTLEFIEQGDSTLVVLTHERLANEAMIIPHRLGWNAALDHLNRFLGVSNTLVDVGEP